MLGIVVGCATAPPPPVATNNTTPRPALPGFGWLDPSRDPMLSDTPVEARGEHAGGFCRGDNHGDDDRRSASPQ